MTLAVVPDPEEGSNEVEFDPTLLALKVEEAARRIGVSRTTMFALIREGEVQTILIGRLRRVPVQALSDYLTTRMQRQSRRLAA